MKAAWLWWGPTKQWSTGFYTTLLGQSNLGPGRIPKVCFLFSCRLKNSQSRFIYSRTIEFCFRHEMINRKKQIKWWNWKMVPTCPNRMCLHPVTHAMPSQKPSMCYTPHHTTSSPLPIPVSQSPESFLNLGLLTQQGLNHSPSGKNCYGLNCIPPKFIC